MINDLSFYWRERFCSLIFYYKAIKLVYGTEPFCAISTSIHYLNIKNYLTIFLVKNKTNVEQKNSNTKPNTPNTKGTRADRGDLGAPAFGKSWKFKTGKVWLHRVSGGNIFIKKPQYVHLSNLRETRLPASKINYILDIGCSKGGVAGRDVFKSRLDHPSPLPNFDTLVNLMTKSA